MKYYLLVSTLCCFFFSEAVRAQDFPNPLPIPYQINSDTILLEMTDHLHSFNPGDPDHYLFDPVRTFAFNEVGAAEPMTVLGPTLTWNFGASLHNEVTNNIDRISTTHWHGAHVPAHADGGPHQKIQVGHTWEVDFDVLDKSATMWYHPHAIDITYEQVQMGLSGMIYVEDPADGVGDDPILTAIHSYTPHDYGLDDFPLIFQTKYFVYDSSNMTYRIEDQKGFKKDYEYLVNGVMNPYLEVPANMIRLRVLNGDGKFTFNFALGDKNFNKEPFQLIATDAGYMFHCHILPHEDKGMMGQFVVWDGSVVSDVQPPLNVDKTLRLFPNPATDRLHLEGSNDEESQIRIYNLQGQLLMAHKLPPFTERIDFSINGLPPGLVLVEWRTREGRFTSKVVVRR